MTGAPRATGHSRTSSREVSPNPRPACERNQIRSAAAQAEESGGVMAGARKPGAELEVGVARGGRADLAADGPADPEVGGVERRDAAVGVVERDEVAIAAVSVWPEEEVAIREQRRLHVGAAEPRLGRAERTGGLWRAELRRRWRRREHGEDESGSEPGGKRHSIWREERRSGRQAKIDGTPSEAPADPLNRRDVSPNGPAVRHSLLPGRLAVQPAPEAPHWPPLANAPAAPSRERGGLWRRAPPAGRAQAHTKGLPSANGRGAGLSERIAAPEAPRWRSG